MNINHDGNYYIREYDLYYWAEKNEYVSNCINEIIKKLTSKFDFVLKNHQELSLNLLQEMLRYYLLTGDAFIEVHYNDSNFINLEVIPPEHLKYNAENGKWFNIKNHAYYTATELIHFHRPGINLINNIYGESVIDILVEPIKNTYNIDNKQEISDKWVILNIEQITMVYGVPYQYVANIKGAAPLNDIQIEMFETKLKVICDFIKGGFNLLDPEYELEITDRYSKKIEIHPPLFRAGVYTINEVREYFDLEPFPDEYGIHPAVVNGKINPLLLKDRDFLNLYRHSELK